MANTKQIFSKSDILEMKNKAWDALQNQIDVPVVFDASVDFVVLGVGVAMGNAFAVGYGLQAIYLDACEGVLQNLLSDTFAYYKLVSDLMEQNDYDSVKLDFNYRMIYFRQRRGWEGGYLPTQDDIPSATAFHGRTGWVLA